MVFEREEALLHGQYALTEVLGHGGFGLVLGGHHRDIGLPVAVKRIDTSGADPDAGVRLRDEARVLAQLHHPHVVRVYDYVTDGELHLLVMERLDGGTLRRYFPREGFRDRPVLDVCAAGLVVAAALDAAHRRGVVHRDVKPDNVLLGTDRTLKLADFGIAKILDADDDASTRAGTPLYAAPEQLAGGLVSPATDVYALGVTLFELLTGRRPITGAELRAGRRHDRPSLPEAPPALAAVVARTLSVEPASRQPSGRELALDLAQATARTYGPGWLGRTAVTVHVDEEIRAATLVGRPGPPTSTGTPATGAPATGTTGTGAPGTGTTLAAPPPQTPGIPVPTSPGPATSRPAPKSPAPSSSQVPPSSPVTPSSPVPPVPRYDLVLSAENGVYLAAGDGRRVRRRAWPRRPPAPRPVPVPVSVPDAHGLAVGPDGSVYVSQPARHRVVRIAPDGHVAPVLGTGEAGSSGDIGLATLARIDTPYGLAVGLDGALYVADSGNGLIRRVNPVDDLVETVAGGGRRRLRPGSADVDATADPRELFLPRARGVAVDPAGHVLVASTDDHCVIRVGPAGAALVAGCGVAGDSGDGGPAEQARLRRPGAVAALPDGGVVVADTGNHRIRAVSPDGRITTLAGGRYQAAGALAAPSAIAVGVGGRLFVMCSGSGTIVDLGTTAGPSAAVASPGAIAFWPNPAVQPTVQPVLLVAESMRGVIRVFHDNGSSGVVATATAPAPADARR